jgi:hypothetical protein
MTTIKLKSPITHGETTYEELTFREAEAGDFMLADGFAGEMSRNIAMLAAMAGVPLPAFKKVKARDLSVILDSTKALLGNEETTTGA